MQLFPGTQTVGRDDAQRNVQRNVLKVWNACYSTERILTILSLVFICQNWISALKNVL